jgi:HrpA-like RNA helicase
MIFEDLKIKKEKAFIICTQPRRIAAQSIARRVA